MKLLNLFLILFLLTNCSFDKKSGIWQNNDISGIEKDDQFSEFQNVSTTNEIFDKIIKADLNISFRTSKKIRNNNWQDKYYNSTNNLDNFEYNDLNNLLFKSNRISRSNLNETFLIEENNLVASDIKGNLFVISTTNNKKQLKFNFYKNKFKKIEKNLFKIVENNIIYVSDNIGYIYAFDYKKNKLIWAKNNNIPFRSNLKIINNKLISMNQNNELIIFDKFNGDVLNLIPTEEVILKNEFLSNISLDDKNIYFLNTFGSLYAISNENMQIKWFINLNQSQDSNSNDLFDGTEIIYHDEKIIASSRKFMYVVNALDGKIIYKLNISSLTKPIMINNYFFTVTTNNLLISFDLENGKIIYSYDINQLISEYLNIKKNKAVLKFLMLANNKLLIFLENSFVVHLNLNGEIKKIDRLPDKILSNPIIVNGSIFFINKKNKIVKLD